MAEQSIDMEDPREEPTTRSTTQSIDENQKAHLVLLVSRKAPSKCLHLAFGDTKNDTRIQLWDQLHKTHPNVLNQVWILDGDVVVKDGKVVDIRGELQIRSGKAPQKGLHVQHGRTTNGNPVLLWDQRAMDHQDVKNQLWTIDLKRGLIKTVRDPTKCIHLNVGGISNDTKVHLWDVLSEKHKDVLNQEWTIELLDGVDEESVAIRSNEAVIAGIDSMLELIPSDRHTRSVLAAGIGNMVSSLVSCSLGPKGEDGTDAHTTDTKDGRVQFIIATHEWAKGTRVYPYANEELMRYEFSRKWFFARVAYGVTGEELEAAGFSHVHDQCRRAALKWLEKYHRERDAGTISKQFQWK